MAKVKSTRDIPSRKAMAFDFPSMADLTAFVVKNQLETAYQKFYFQDGMTLIIWAESDLELLQMHLQLKDRIGYDGRVRREESKYYFIADHYKLVPMTGVVA